MCCYPDYVRVTIKVLITKIEEVIGPDCDVGECKRFIQEEYINQKLLQIIPPPTTVIPTTTTSTTTTTTISPPNVEGTDYFNIEITNRLITSIPLFDDIDLTDQDKNSIAVILHCSSFARMV